MRWLRRKGRRNERKRDQLEEEYQRALQWETLQQEGELLRSSLGAIQRGMKEIVVDDWWNPGIKRRISLDPSKTPQEEVALRFKVAKRAKRRLPHYQSLREQLDKEASILPHFIQRAEQVETEEDLRALMEEASYEKKTLPSAPEKEKISLPYKIFYAKNGTPIWVGKGSDKNEEMTFRLARGNDMWIHVSDYPGSHVIIHSEKGKEVDEDTLEDAMTLAFHFSKARFLEQAEIIVTQQKNIRKIPGGKKGQVSVGAHQKRMIRWNPQRFELLQSRKNVSR